MLHRIREAMQDEATGGMFDGEVEADETLLKRSLKGTYVSVEPLHLFRYVDEQDFRYNTRKDNDGGKVSKSDPFHSVCKHVVGRRLTWNWLTGKTESATL